MTRFARAKGSKSSNERVPDEPTPWYIMKQQLEDSAASKRPQERSKSAKELLKEKEEPYYGELGPNNHDWADFGPQKKDSKKNGAKVPEKKKIVSADAPQKKKEIPDAPENAISTKKNKKRKSTVEIPEESTSAPVESITICENDSPKKKKQKTPKKSEIAKKSDSGKERENLNNSNSSNSTSHLNSSNSNSNSNANSNSDSSNLNSNSNSNSSNLNSNSNSLNANSNSSNLNLSQDKSSPVENPEKLGDDKPSVKLSKRQKRNRKNKTNKEGISEDPKEDPKEENKSSTGGFDTDGNDWSSEIKQGNPKKPRNEAAAAGPGSIRGPRNSEGNDPQNRFESQKVAKKRKPAKVRDDKEHKRRKPVPASTKVIINGMEIEIVMYDGFPVKKEDAERLVDLRKQMIMKGIPKSEINAAMKLERRKAEKALTRVKKNVCFHCRKAGHNLSDCPDLGREEAVTGICFKCGSTEHTHFECRVTKKEEFGFAKCFICREQGHIAKQCPDNPKGLYPQGGACKICGDVTHLRKDCPDLVKDKEENAVTLGTIAEDNLESLAGETNTKEKKITKQKIVTF